MQLYKCKGPGCSIILKSPGYCQYHIKDKVEKKPFQNAKRYNTHLYQTSRWKKLRREILLENKCCQMCGSTLQLEVHHRVRPKGEEELFFDKDNLVLVCEVCHRKLTANETHRGC